MTAVTEPPNGSIVVLAGPTASGKTAAALELARRIEGELVGADSVQVYRGFDIGSATPTDAELGGVPHHLIDILEPHETIDAMGYARLADEAIAAIRARGKVPIVVGGTGLWLRALLRGLVDVPPVDPALRERLEGEARALGSPALHRRLREVDPLSAKAIHENDALRIVRALEVHEQTGEPLGELRARHALGGPRYGGVHLFVDRPRADLDERMAKRTDEMMAAGFAREVRGLLERHPRDARAFGSVGYRQMVAHLEDGVGLDETLAAIRKATRTYARRQRTWFSSEPGFEGPVAPESVTEGALLHRIQNMTAGPADAHEASSPTDPR